MKANKVSKINRLLNKILALSFGIWSAAQLGFLPSAVGQPSAVGEWGAVLDWSTNFTGSGHNVAVHLVVLPTGKVIMYPYDTAPRLWDPSDNTLTTLPFPGTSGGGGGGGQYNIFCGAHSHIPDGRVLFSGGDKDAPHHHTHGEPKASYYNPLDSTWTRLPDMMGGRWYPNSTTLASGEVLVTSGFLETGAPNINKWPQVWNPAAGAWWSLTNGTNVVPPLYTRTFLAPNGKVFFAMGETNPVPSNNLPSHYLDATRRPSFNGEWSDPVSTPLLPGHNNPQNPVGSACMDHVGTVYWFGGGLEGWGVVPIAACEKIDLAASTPAWTTNGFAPINTNAVSQPRKYHNATILPDGKFLITGGRSIGEPADPENDPDPEVGGGKAALLYDPVADTWTTLATEARYRGYHSTAVLLPDGRVLSAGGDLSYDTNLVVIPEGTPASATAEIFSPPYLFNGTNLAVRPVIASAPSVVGYGETFFVGTTDAASITNVTWTRLGSTTHGFNWEQRINVLTFTQTSCGLDITAPANQTNCPPGYYMLWLINSNGVPSNSRMVRISKGLSGAFVFSCDTNGNVAGDFGWDTRGLDSDFYKIFVTKGTPLGILNGLTNTLLNGTNWERAPLSLKLDPGENKFTIFFQDAGSWTNFGMNLFFDDGIVGEISVKAELYNGGSIPAFSANSANPTYTFTSYPDPDAPATNTLIAGYGRRIELTEFYIAATNVYSSDRVSTHDVGANGVNDYVGTFTLRVTDADLITSNLVAHWRLDEASGNRVDAHADIVLSSINGVDQGAGKVCNAASFSAAGVWPNWSEQSLGTAWADPELSMGDIDFTIAGWVNFTALEMTGLAGKWADQSLEYIVYTDGNNLRFHVSSNGYNNVSVVDSTAIATNTWYFFCCWHDATANTINISVNNNAPSSVAHSTGVFDGNAIFYLGRNEEGGTWLPGRLDSISVWKRVLDSTERTRLYNAGLGLDYPF